MHTIRNNSLSLNLCVDVCMRLSCALAFVCLISIIVSNTHCRTSVCMLLLLTDDYRCNKREIKCMSCLAVRYGFAHTFWQRIFSTDYCQDLMCFNPFSCYMIELLGSNCLAI